MSGFDSERHFRIACAPMIAGAAAGLRYKRGTRMTTKKKTAAGGMAVALIALTLAGCGSKSAEQGVTNTAATNETAPSASASAPFDPCSVLTGDEVAAVTGLKVTKTEVIDHDCHYYDDLNHDDGTAIQIYRTGGKEQMRTIRESNKLLGGIGAAVAGQSDVGRDVQASITAPAADAAPAIGDEAVWQPNDVLSVRKGDLFVTVSPPIAQPPAKHRGIMISDADKRTISQKLAEAVFAKLSH